MTVFYDQCLSLRAACSGAIRFTNEYEVSIRSGRLQEEMQGKAPV